MRPANYHYFLLLLLVSLWTNGQPLSSSALAPPLPQNSDVFPIARIYRQQIDDQLALPPLVSARPVPLKLGLHPLHNDWLEDERLAGLNPPDPLSAQMSLQV